MKQIEKIMNIQQCCKLGNLGSLIGWESSGLQRTQIGLWRKHCVTSARWLLLFLEGTKNTKEEYLVFGILTQCHGNDVNSCGCESAKICLFPFFWFMIYVLWWDLMRHDDLQDSFTDPFVWCHCSQARLAEAANAGAVLIFDTAPVQVTAILAVPGPFENPRRWAQWEQAAP